MSFFSRKKKKSKPIAISKPFPPNGSQWNRDAAGYPGYGYPTSAPAHDYSAWKPPVPYFSPGSPPWKGSSNSSSDRAAGRAERYEAGSTSQASSYDYGFERAVASRQGRARPDDYYQSAASNRPRPRRYPRPPSPEEEELQAEEYSEDEYDQLPPTPAPQHRSRRRYPDEHSHRYRAAPSETTSYTYQDEAYHRARAYSDRGDQLRASPSSNVLRPARSAANLTLAESDLYGDKTVVSTAYTRHNPSKPVRSRPGTPSSHHTTGSQKKPKQPRPPAGDGSDIWCTRSGEPLARVRLTTVLKSLEESDESLFFSLTTFTLDLSEPDPSGTTQETFISLACQVLSHLSRLETLRIIGSKDRRITLPSSFAAALQKSRAGLLSFALSRIAAIDEVAELAKAVGPTCTSLKLNDCKLPVWRPFLRHCVYLESLEALVQPEGLTWFSRSQWSQLISLRLGYGSPESLEDLLESATAVVGEEPYQTALETLVISHFAPLPLPLVIRLSRTLGTPLVRKLELSRVQGGVFEPRLIQNLAAYFESVEDLRLHAAEEGEEELSVAEGRKRRTKPVDWTQGRWGIDDWGMALSAFPILRAIEMNHSRHPHLLDHHHHQQQSSSHTKDKSGDASPSGIPDTPDGVPLSDLWLVDARGLANKCRTLKRVGYSFGVQGRYLDCSVKFSRTQRGALPIVTPHWSKPSSST